MCNCQSGPTGDETGRYCVSCGTVLNVDMIGFDDEMQTELEQLLYEERVLALWDD